MANAGDIEVQLKVEAKKFIKAMGQAEKAAKKTTKNTERRFKGMGKSILKAAAAVGVFAAALKAVTTVKTLTTQLALSGREITNWSKTLGISTNALQGFAAAGAHVGFSFEKTTDILKDVSDKIGDFVATGGGEAKTLFERLGLGELSLSGKDPAKALGAIVNQMELLGNVSTQEENFLLEAIANDASKLKVLLKDNGKLYKQLAKEAEKAGAIISPKELKSLEKFQSISRVIGLQWKGVKKIFTIHMLPAVTKLAARIKKAFESGEIQKFAEILANKVSKGITSIGDAMPSIIEGFKNLSTVLSFMANTLAKAVAFASTLSSLDPTKGTGGPLMGAAVSKFGISGVEQTRPGDLPAVKTKSSTDIIKELLQERKAQEKGQGNNKGFDGWVDAFGAHVESFGQSTASQTAVGKVLAARGKPNLNEILGGGVEQVKSGRFNDMARALVDTIQKGTATDKSNEYFLNQLKTITHVAGIGKSKGATSGLLGAIKELQVFIKAGKKDKEVMKVDVDVEFNDPMFTAKVNKTMTAQFKKSAAETGQ